jgi:hypothetical protein
MQRADDRALQLRLVGVYRQLATALEERDWDRFAGIDQTLRQVLLELVECDVVSAETLHIKKQLQVLHGRAIAACNDICEKLRRVLQTHREYEEGRSAYVRIDLLRGEK